MTNDQYTTFSGLLNVSKAIITSLERADYIDRLLIVAALLFFVLVCAFIIKRRVLDKGLRIVSFVGRLVPRGAKSKASQSAIKSASSLASVAMSTATALLSTASTIAAVASSSVSASSSNSASETMASPIPEATSTPIIDEVYDSISSSTEDFTPTYMPTTPAMTSTASSAAPEESTASEDILASQTQSVDAEPTEKEELFIDESLFDTDEELSNSDLDSDDDTLPPPEQLLPEEMEDFLPESIPLEDGLFESVLEEEDLADRTVLLDTLLTEAAEEGKMDDALDAALEKAQEPLFGKPSKHDADTLQDVAEEAEEAVHQRDEL